MSKLRRLLTCKRLQRARHLRSLNKRKTAAQKDQVAEYKTKLAAHAQEKKAANQAIKAQKKAKR